MTATAAPGLPNSAFSDEAVRTDGTPTLQWPALMEEDPLEEESSPAPPPTRVGLLMRSWLGALLAIAALWLPVDRLSWSLETARAGVFENAVIVDSDSGDDAATAQRRRVTCEYGDPRETLSFIDDSGLAPGDAVPVAYLPSAPRRAVRAEPGTGALGLYFATESWIVDAALWPIGLVLALAALSNLFALKGAARA